MNDLRIPGIVYGFLLAIGVLDWVRRYPLLPARMASHCGPHGGLSAPRELGESAAQRILVSRGTARRDDAISEHEIGMVCLRGAVFASVRDFRSNLREHAIAWTI
jgi:hypothetical protein